MAIILDESAAATRLALPVRKLRRLARAGQIPSHVLPGTDGERRFVDDELLAWLRELPSTAHETFPALSRGN